MDKTVIVHVGISFSGGIGSFAKNLIQYQLSKGYIINVLTFEPENDDEKDFCNSLEAKVKITYVKKNIFNKRPIITGVSFNKEIKKILVENRNHKVIVHAHNPASIGVLSNINKINLVCTIHGKNTVNSFVSNLLTKKILSKFKNDFRKIVCVSNETKKYYSEELKNNQISVIHNGVRKNSDCSNEQNSIFTLGFIARIVNGKGLMETLNTAVLLKNDQSLEENFKLVICGDGEKSDVDKMLDFIRANDLNDTVEYIGYVKNAGDTVIPNLNLLLLPSDSEGLPMSIIESLAYSVPVLATEVGGIPEVIKDNYNGKLINKNPNDIAHKVSELIMDKKFYDQMKRNAEKSYEENFTLEVMGINYDRLYDSIYVEKK